ncbi:cytochrome P450 [Xylaria cf. heliscus]|nr:cytochrome P450 [Xylaria cf. heliscus]
MLQALRSLYVTLQDQLAAIHTAMAPVRLTKWEMLQLALRKIRYDIMNAAADLSPTAKYVGLAVPIIIAALLIDEFRVNRQSLRRLGLPFVRPSKRIHRWDYTAILDEGARKHPNSPFIISYSGFEYVVFPPSMWDEVKRIPQTKASAMEFFKHVFFGGWGFLGTDISALHKSIGTDLTRAIPIRTQAHYESAQFASEVALGSCQEWKSFKMYWTLQDIVSTTNAIGLVGEELGTDPRWRSAVQQFPMAIVLGIIVSGWAPRVLRPIVTWFIFLPAWGLYWWMRFLLRPIVNKDVREYEAALKEIDKSQLMQASPDKKFPMTAWLMARYRPEERNPQQVAHDFIVASFESTASTSGTFYFIMAELVTRPGLCEELREEISQVMVDGKLPRTNLTELKKLDSVMRECSRWNPFGHMALFRRLREPVQLSTGPELPAGTVMSVDIHKVPKSEELWSDPDTFDPMRFLKLRQLPGREDRHQFTSLGADTPGWGDGSQACPGRTFAGNTLKVALAYLLMNYDFRIPEGGDKPKRYSMPNGSFRPDMGVRIEFRERRDATQAAKKEQ